MLRPPSGRSACAPSAHPVAHGSPATRTRPARRAACPATAAARVCFPPYTPVPGGPGYELRLYAPHFVISTLYDRRDDGFARLGAYAAGANADKTRFLESQPVFMTPWASPKRMFLHCGITAGGEDVGGEPPAPAEAGVAVDVEGGRLLAVAKFEGFATPGAAATARDELLAALEASGLATDAGESFGGVLLAQYGPLFTLETRMNEVLVPVAV